MANTAMETRERTQAPARDQTRGGSVYFTPAVDIYETPEELVLLADIPGADQEKVDLRYENGVLTLFAPCLARGGNGAEPFVEEFGVGDYYRAFDINEEIDPEKIEAGFANGVLTVKLHKAEAAKPRKIEVKAIEGK